MGILHKFYVAYDQWIKGGAVGPEFSRYTGLCSNLYDFAERIGVDPSKASVKLHESFLSSGKDMYLPFDGDGEYGVSAKYGQCHLNPARRAWVKTQLKVFGGNDETSSD